MHSRFHPSSLSLVLIRRCAVVALFACASLSAMAADPTGVWTFTVQNPGADADGTGSRKVEATLQLKWADQKLSGTLQNRAGEAKISDATFDGENVRFTVVRTFGRFFKKRTFTTHYQGKLTDTAIDGTIDATGRDDQPVSLPWHAERSS